MHRPIVSITSLTIVRFTIGEQYFSEFINKNPDLESEIYISDNFIFDEIYNPNWKNFKIVFISNKF